MHKIVLSSSTLWLFDIIKNMVSSTVPEKKRGSWSWAVSFLCIHTDETEIQSRQNPCWFDTCIWSQLCWFDTCIGSQLCWFDTCIGSQLCWFDTCIWSQLCFAPHWGIQSWKSLLWKWSPCGSSSFGQERADCAWRNPHSWNTWKSWHFNLHNWKDCARLS